MLAGCLNLKLFLRRLIKGKNFQKGKNFYFVSSLGLFQSAIIHFYCGHY